MLAPLVYGKYIDAANPKFIVDNLKLACDSLGVEQIMLEQKQGASVMEVVPVKNKRNERAYIMSVA